MKTKVEKEPVLPEDFDLEKWLGIYVRYREHMLQGQRRQHMAMKAVKKWLIANPDEALKYGFRVADGRLYTRTGAMR